MGCTSRRVTDDDLKFDIVGRPYEVCVVFRHFDAYADTDVGHRRPKKIKGEWFVRRYYDRHLTIDNTGGFHAH